jgi:hypothetical protein
MSFDRTGEICGISISMYVAGHGSTALEGNNSVSSVLITLFVAAPNSDQGKTVGVRDYQTHAPLQLQRLSLVAPGPNTSVALRSKDILKTFSSEFWVLLRLTAFRKNNVMDKSLKPRGICINCGYYSTGKLFLLNLIYLGPEWKYMERRLALPLCIREVPDSSLCPEIGYPECFLFIS